MRGGGREKGTDLCPGETARQRDKNEVSGVRLPGRETDLWWDRASSRREKKEVRLLKGLPSIEEPSKDKISGKKEKSFGHVCFPERRRRTRANAQENTPYCLSAGGKGTKYWLTVRKTLDKEKGSVSGRKNT